MLVTSKAVFSSNVSPDAHANFSIAVISYDKESYGRTPRDWESLVKFSRQKESLRHLSKAF